MFTSAYKVLGDARSPRSVMVALTGSTHGPTSQAPNFFPVSYADVVKHQPFQGLHDFTWVQIPCRKELESEQEAYAHLLSKDWRGPTHFPTVPYRNNLAVLQEQEFPKTRGEATRKSKVHRHYKNKPKLTFGTKQVYHMSLAKFERRLCAEMGLSKLPHSYPAPSNNQRKINRQVEAIRKDLIARVKHSLHRALRAIDPYHLWSVGSEAGQLCADHYPITKSAKNKIQRELKNIELAITAPHRLNNKPDNV